MKFDAMGVGKHEVGGTEGWMVSFVKNPDEVAEGEFPDFHHFIFPPHTFAIMAEDMGLDVDEDFYEVFDIVMHDQLAGNDQAEDMTEPAVAAKGKHNKLGRKLKRRAERAKAEHEVTGLEDIRARLHPERQKGARAYKDRMVAIQAVRDKAAQHHIPKVDLPYQKGGPK